MKNLLVNIKSLTQWLIPNHCLLCADFTTNSIALCSPCLSAIPSLDSVCLRCASAKLHAEHCPVCANQQLYFDVTIAAAPYCYELSILIKLLKFRQQLSSSSVLASLLLPKLHQHYHERNWPEMIIPIPLHPKRLKERGYNQALEIAKPIARELQLPIEYRSSWRTKATNAQTFTGRRQRAANLRRAFASTICANHIAIIDDVVTTGSTVNAFAKVLKENGVKQIDVWCCARTSTTHISQYH